MQWIDHEQRDQHGQSHVAQDSVPGDSSPSIVRSARMRPMWIANSVRMNAIVQARSVGARPRSAASTSAASATASGSPVSPSSRTTVSSASAVVWTGAVAMFQAMPTILPAPATAMTHASAEPRANRSRRARDRVPERGQRGERALGAVGPAECPDRVADGVNREPASHEQPQAPGRDKWRVDQKDRNRHADHPADRRPPAQGGVRLTHGVEQLEARRKREQPSHTGGGEFRSAHRSQSARRPSPSVTTPTVVIRRRLRPANASSSCWM